MAKTKKIATATKVAPTRKPTKAAQAPKVKARGIEKKFLKTRPVCKVTFTLPREAAPEAETVCVMGEFNNWSPDATPMKRRTNGDFVASLDLEKGRSYRFRYLIDGWKFENDWQADRYESNPYGGEDSVVEV
jgi:1,4-alpha-glucan branching enzyme